MNVSFTIFRRLGSREHWTLVGAIEHELSRSGNSAPKLERTFRDALRKLLAKTPAAEVRSLERAAGIRLEHVRLELSLSSELGRRSISGRCPIILEPRLAGAGRIFTIAYHPERKQEWFGIEDGADLAAQATRFFQHAWRDLQDYEIAALFSRGTERLHTIGVSGALKDPKLPRSKRTHAGLGPAREKVLSALASDRTEALEGKRPEQLGASRQPFRSELSALISGAKKRSVLVVGEPGSGRTTLIDQAVWDLLQADDYPSHRNLDRVHHVYQLSGRQLIAGMSYVGDWEQRCFDLFQEGKKQRALLSVPDLASFGRTGRSRQSDRSLADVFRGPIARGELTVIAELTPSELARLEEDAPGFVAAFARITLPPSDTEETLRMLLRSARELEARSPLRIGSDALFSVLDLASNLDHSRSLPGSALDWLARLSRGLPQDVPTELTTPHVFGFVTAHTGLRRVLFDPREALTLEQVQRALEQRVLGQSAAVAEVANVVLKIKAGLTDPRRPYGVLLFTGPTGTGKTELAKALAEYLYGSDERLIRFDMGEYTGADALPRLIGDVDGGDGALTRALAEQPFAVLLLDELEKAHASVFPLLLQLLDEGRLSGADGRTTSFRNAVVLMTSNLGARARPAPGFGSDAAGLTADALRAVREFFAPELFNRIDRVVSFSPLSLEHARGIVQRELTRLYARPGLRDRNAVVIGDAAAVARIAETAFRSEEGARSLRRFLEDRVASVLADAIARTPDAALRIVRWHASEGGFQVEEQRLVEASPLPARFALEPVLSRPLREVLAQLPAMRLLLDALAESPALPALAERIGRALRAHAVARRSGDGELYSLEWLRGELATLREQLERFAQTPAERALEHAEASADFVVTPGHHEAPDSTELVRPRSRSRAVPSRDELARFFARAYFLRRALRRVAVDNLHAVEIELLAIAPRHPTLPGLLSWLSRAYASAYGELDGFAASSGDQVWCSDSASALGDERLERASCAVLRLVGPCVRDFFEPEDGMHVLVPASRDTELVRVRVRSAQSEQALDARVRELVRELDRAAPALYETKLTRLVRFEPPRAPGSTGPIEIEDYPHAYVAATRVERLDQALVPLWLLRLSREDIEP